MKFIKTLVWSLVSILDKNFKFLTGIMAGIYIGVCFFFYGYQDWFELQLPKNLWEIISVVSTIFSAVGLISVGILTYKNQRHNAFQEEFDNLLREHGLLLKKCFYESDDILNFNASYLLHKVTAKDIDFKYVSESYIYGREEVSRYFILLYRILDRIDKGASETDKNRYSGIIRVSIPHEILLLVAINSLNSNFRRYKELLEKFSFLEHLPLSNRFIATIRINNAKYLLNHKKSTPNAELLFEHRYDAAYEHDLALERNITCNIYFEEYEHYLSELIHKTFDKNIWGNNIYINRMVFNRDKQEDICNM